MPIFRFGKNVHTEPAKLGVEVREIDLPILLEILHKVLGAHAEDDSLNPFFGRLGKVAVAQATAHAEVDVLILLDVKVGHVFIDGILQNEIEKAQVLVLNGHVRLQTVPALGGFIGYTEITGGETQANVLVLGQLHAAGGFVLGPVFEWDFFEGNILGRKDDAVFAFGLIAAAFSGRSLLGRRLLRFGNGNLGSRFCGRGDFACG